MQKVVYPGTFDPITYGHIDLAERAYDLFGNLTIGIGENPDKSTLFSLEERIKMTTQCMEKIAGDIEITHFDGLLVHFMQEINGDVIIRGLRALSDFEYEFQMALTNRKLEPDVETIFLMPHEKYSYLSSTLIKTLGKNEGKISCFVPQLVERKIQKKFGSS